MLNKQKNRMGWAIILLLLIGPGLVACGASSTPDRLTGQPAPSRTPSLTPIVSVSSAPTTGITRPDVNVLHTQLSESWTNYTTRFIQQDGRVLDPSDQAVSTSESQSYALLRSVWSNDQATFERVWHWTKDNLQTRPDDKLFAYRWGQTGNNEWRQIDKASASDADQDIALALIFADRRWSNTDYRPQAQAILDSIWQKEVVTVSHKPYLSAGDWAPAQDRPTLNPSYMEPYAYRIFATVDPAHAWPTLVETAYEVIKGCSETSLDGKTAAQLPANWCGIDQKTGQFTTAQDYPSLTTNYGFDAFRTMWRVAVDYKWFGEKRALDYLKASSKLRDDWKQNGKLAAEYDYSGKVVNPQENLAVYGGDLANLELTDPAMAAALVNSKLIPAYVHKVDPQDAARTFSGWGDQNNYYNQNWVWLGLALYSDQLPNLAATIPPATK